MKKTLLLLSLLFLGIVQAQIVNIPDANFKDKMVNASTDNPAARDINYNPIVVDTNNDGEIQQSEALAVYVIHVGGANISSFVGIEAFSNVQEVVAGSNNLTTFDATVLPNLKKIFISDNYNLISINVSGMTSLEELYISSNALASLNLSSLPNLKKIHCGENDLTSLTISGLPNLTHINLQENFYGDPSTLQELIISDLPAIREIDIENCQLSSLDVSGIPSLRAFLAAHNPFNQLDLSNLPLLMRIDLSYSQITSLDLGNCLVLNTINFQHNPQLKYINLKNGSACNLYLISQNPALKYICIDAEEETAILEDLAFYNVTNVQVNSYCTFTPGSEYNIITGSLLFDNEGNGCDTNDTVISNIKLNINDGTESGSTISSTGVYSFYTQSGTFTVTPDFESDYFTITPPFAEINFTEVDSLVTTQNFCLTPNGNHPDLDIVIVPFGARPGFDADYKIIYRNKGNQTLSGGIAFAYEEDVMDFVSANPSEDSSSSGTLTWNYTGLAPFQQREILVTLNVNGPMETPAVNIDDNLQFTATINPITGDDTPLDNVFGLKETVIGSFDPNDITCLEGDSVNPDKIGEYLHYNINFENTGTAPATFIVVKDVIDTAQFDMATLQMINASHPVQAKITGNKVEFRFDDINLGPEGKGNVVFKIKTLNTLQTNDDVTQQADIFFDYNWPIQTNEATTVFEVLSRGEFERDNSVKVYPNPSNGMVNITAASEIRSVELYDIQGRLLQAGSNDSLDISGRAAGMYFVKVLTEAGMKVEKVVKK